MERKDFGDGLEVSRETTFGTQVDFEIDARLRRGVVIKNWGLIRDARQTASGSPHSREIVASGADFELTEFLHANLPRPEFFRPCYDPVSAKVFGM